MREYSNYEEVKKQIEKNYSFISEIERLVDEEEEINDKLELISLVGKLYSEFVTGIYASNTLERTIQKCSNDIQFERSKTVKKDKVLIVMSEAAYIGGHTTLVHNWIQWDQQKSYSIVFTKQKYKYIPKFLIEDVKMSKGIIYTLAGDYIQKATQLLNISQEYERILLFHHMYDIIPIMSYCNSNWDTPVYLYNHADFRFSFGYSVSDVVLNLVDYDVEKTVYARGYKKNSSLLLEFPGQGLFERPRAQFDYETNRKEIENEYGISDQKIITSMGDDFKFNKVIGYEFDRFVYRLISESDYVFLIIGANPENEKWKHLNELTQGRAMAIGQVSSEKAERIIASSDLFILSFPMLASGRQWAEAHSVPWLGLNTIGRFTSGNDRRISNTIDEMILKAKDILLNRTNMDIDGIRGYSMPKNEWVERWSFIYDTNTKHSICELNPMQIFEKREMINCQLMQENAEKNIYNTILSYNITEKANRKIETIIKKYGLDTISDCIRLKLQQEKKLYLSRLNKINKKVTIINQNEISIKGYMEKKDYSCIAAYGFGDLYEEISVVFEKEKIVNFIIDKRAAVLNSIIPICSPQNINKKPDLIINFTKCENAELKNEIKYNDITIIKIEDLLDEIIRFNGCKEAKTSGNYKF